MAKSSYIETPVESDNVRMVKSDQGLPLSEHLVLFAISEDLLFSNRFYSVVLAGFLLLCEIHLAV